MKIFLILLTLLLIYLQYHLWFGPGSYEEQKRLQQLIVQQQQENAALQQRNDFLAAEVNDLKHGTEAIEERARAELGLIKPGEVFYQIVEE
jgi:cell division protein FtsB